MGYIEGDNEREASSFRRHTSCSSPTQTGGASTQDCSAALDKGSSSMEGPREEILVEAARAGCMRSFETLYSLYNRRVFRTILSITYNREDAEDVLQQSFLQAYVGIGRFEGRSTFYSWITRIAINSSLMILRQRRTHPQIACRHWPESDEDMGTREIPDTAPNPEQLYERSQQTQRLSAAVKRLRPSERMVLEHQLEKDSSIEDLADSLDISKLAAKSRLYRARTHLMSRLKSQEAGKAKSLATSK